MGDSAPLRWIERGLLAVGLCLGVWSAVMMIEARRVADMPVPDAPAATGAVPLAEPAEPFASRRRFVGGEARRPVGAIVSDGARGNRRCHPRPGSRAHRRHAVSRTTRQRRYRRASRHDVPAGAAPANRRPAGTDDSRRCLPVPDHQDLHRRSQGCVGARSGRSAHGDTRHLLPFMYIGNAPRRYIIQAVLIDQAARTAGAEAGNAGN